MNEVQLEAALLHSDPDSEARKAVEAAIRKIVQAELERNLSQYLEQHVGTISSIAESAFYPSRTNFRDGVLSVLKDHTTTPRPFNQRY